MTKIRDIDFNYIVPVSKLEAFREMLLIEDTAIDAERNGTAADDIIDSNYSTFKNI